MSNALPEIHTLEHTSIDWIENNYIRSLRKLIATERASQEKWMIKMDAELKPKESVLQIKIDEYIYI